MFLQLILFSYTQSVWFNQFKEGNLISCTIEMVLKKIKKTILTFLVFQSKMFYQVPPYKSKENFKNLKFVIGLNDFN